MAEDCEWFDSDIAAYAALQQHELDTNTCYVAQKSRNLGISDVQSLNGYKIWWEDSGHAPGFGPNIPGDGIPFVVIGNVTKKSSVNNDESDHTYAGPAVKSRRMVQKSKKQGCPAKVRFRKIIKFPEFQVVYQLLGLADRCFGALVLLKPLDKTVTPMFYHQIKTNVTAWRRRVMAQQLRESFNNETSQEYRVYLSLPVKHQGHLQGELAGFCLPVDKRLLTKIKDLYNQGIRKVRDVRNLLKIFVEQELHIDVPPTSRRFNPTDKDIRNHLLLAAAASRYNPDDQQNLLIQINKWRQEKANDNFYMRPASLPEDNEKQPTSFLLIIQTEFQRNLLVKYGQEIVLMDATYKTTKYDLPLFVLSVCSNVSYQAVGAFVVERETEDNIAEALRIFATWNQNWKPRFFMCDFDYREISALERTFKGCFVYLCAFHREQAWERWLKDKTNGAFEIKDDLLMRLRRIANSETNVIFQDEVDQLKKSDIFLQNVNFQNYFRNQWLSDSKRWVYCFRFDMFNIKINTTNGLEKMHCDLKFKYLKNIQDGKSLSSMVSIIVNEMMPESKNTYIRKNLSYMHENRSYSSNVPSFLQDRPRQFVTHCLDRMPPSVLEIPPGSVICTEDGFNVRSPESNNWYTLFINTGGPYCSCSDWKRNHWPCKHLLALFNQYPAYGWDFLPSAYKNQPLFNLDSDLTEKAVFSDSKVVNIEECIASETEEHIEFPDLVQEECQTELTEMTERKKCLIAIKDITNAVYSVSSPETLHNVHNMLINVDSFLQELIPKLSGLPIKTKIPGQKRKVRRNVIQKKKVNRKNVPTKKGVTKKGVLEVASESMKCGFQYQSEETEFVSSNMPDLIETENLEEYEQEVMTIWRKKTSTHTILGRIGAYTISDTAILCAKTLLSDDLIDAYLHLLAAASDSVYYINAAFSTAIFNNTQEMDLYSYEHIIGAVNEGGNHWVLLIAEHFLHGKPLVFNMTREDLNRYRKKLASFVLFKARYVRGTAQLSAATSNSDRENVAAPVSASISSSNDEKDTDKVPSSKHYHLRTTKKRVSERRDSCFDFSSGKRTYCICKKKNDGKLYWQCEKCWEWFHPQCLGFSGTEPPQRFTCISCQEIERRHQTDQQSDVKTTDDVDSVQHGGSCITLDSEEEEVPKGDSLRDEGYNVLNSGRPVKEEEEIEDALPKEDLDSSEDEGDSNMNLGHIVEEEIEDELPKEGIPKEYCISKMPEVLKHLYTIMKCSNQVCNEPDHERHHEFISTPLIVYERERRTVAFGLDIFQIQAVHDITLYLNENIAYNARDYKIANDYMLDVVIKEALVYLICMKKKCPYEHANDLCKASEEHMDSVLGKKKQQNT
ncbi:unnamed protein product [Mytilus coruscus]|uniref:SWIM-type domain-containing protein n=1 Tax=Mytilus coruscus TaxID=42192 RepID=A0A6J8BU50_MYTCO|nr:unnamed protein product [Mytilus coruscus]